MRDKLIDIHCHILPGLDDGPKTMEESIKMVTQAVKQGISGIIATPHYIPGELEVKAEEVLKKVAMLQRKVDEAGLACKIYPGMELYLSAELINHIDQGRVLSLGEKSKYLLVEFPGAEMSSNQLDLLHELKIRGFRPIIAHPERNGRLLETPEIVNELLGHKALLQINATSIIGGNGKRVQQLAQELVQQGLVSFVASDGHSVERRKIRTEEAYKQLKNVVSPGIFNSIFFINCNKIIYQEEIPHVSLRYERVKSGIFGSLRKLIFLK